MDRRQKKTRQAVFQAFTWLLEHKGYGHITVQEIIDKANIGRSTFYAHFETKDDLLKALCTEIFHHVFSEELDKEETHDFSSRENGIEERIVHILYHLSDSRSYIKGVLLSESGEMFMRYFKEYLTRVFDKALTDQESSVPRDYMLHHMVCSFAESVRWWMDHEEYSPEEVGSFYMMTNRSALFSP